MKEIKDIINAYHQARSQGQATALATVVLVEGSSYRRPGARMLVTDEGQLTGAISGGCLEGDALRKALLAISQKKNKLVTYDTTEGNNTTLGVQLGCNGIVHILFEPIDGSMSVNPMVLLAKLLEDRCPSVLITLFDHKAASGPHPGTCLLFSDTPQTSEMTGNSEFRTHLIDEIAQQTYRAQTSVFEEINLADKRLTAFAEWIPPSLRLLVVGAGNDTIPLSYMAAHLGWEVQVIDGRSSHCNSERFPGASICRVAKAEKVVEGMSIDLRTAVLLMTHNYRYDLQILMDLLPRTDLRYLGILGPKSKLEKMYTEIEEQSGATIPDSQKAKVYGPIGLEIGAETSDEISLSILAEIQGVFAGKTGRSLRYKDAPIHHPLQIPENL
ncbi:XdhC family protein [Dyadobacter tibetensis]|uniref:XdhC family protein n=1 Tax=Dyadobacter tibetensis TaxID=1211851 RepID=UPI00046EF059|nr:XdhC/CoxI family protein [Dyadobacter tibetensis]